MKTKTKIKSSLLTWLALSVFALLANSQATAQIGGWVTLYDSANHDTKGLFQNFRAGTHLLDQNDGWMNDKASSIRVPDGYEVWLCDAASGPSRDGSNACSSYFEGKYNLNQSLNDRVSYLSVQYNKYVKTGVACLFAGPDQMGLSLCLNKAGTYLLDSYKFEHPANFDLPNVGDWRYKASSVWVKSGYTARLCSMSASFNNITSYGDCTVYGAGEHTFSAERNNKSMALVITNERTRKILVPIQIPPVNIIRRKKT